MSALEKNLREFIDVIREDGKHEGRWATPAPLDRPYVPYVLTVGLARFQSYRGRTEAALVQEIIDWLEDTGGWSIRFRVQAESSTVLLEV